ncbi:hypothetical protein ACO0RG_003026 [Hanseniaspora osmophila]|mgnify:CR=1 FL=1
MAYFKITLARSVIGLPQNKRKIVSAIGLTKRGRTIYRQVTPGMAGALAQVKELVEVEVSPVFKSKADLREERKSNPGYQVLGNSLQQ